MANHLQNLLELKSEDTYVAILKAYNSVAVVAAGGGRVLGVGESESGGEYVLVDHGLGVVSRYARLERISVQAGQMVERGQRLAYLNGSDRGESSDLYFEIRVDGEPVNPRHYLEK